MAEQIVLEYLKSTKIIEPDGDCEEDDEQLEHTLLNYELLRHKKMSRKMRADNFDEPSERLLAASSRHGSDYEKFWNTKKSAFPLLSSVYLKLLPTPASSSIVESSFLFLKNIQEGRTQLSEAHLDDLLQLFFDQKI